ncbi:hypothetical protein Y032_0086g1896 [Ancylostoma ceylanicum]|uniref:Uncharacterized protein n=1 Tax=Ancylostoma ceylanicum TaxID=53326 RepID=A0A016TPJ0_9BILA|nr:hypothetical protein Y032_0086g1893 [Ancylostoma ceylanicum]EYC04631.1 hypothetical protein Y032_0086g1896 [Ancylostoma ceylanicum]
MTGRVVGEVTAGRKGDGAGQSARRLARPFGAGAGSSLYGLSVLTWSPRPEYKKLTACLRKPWNANQRKDLHA